MVDHQSILLLEEQDMASKCVADGYRVVHVLIRSGRVLAQICADLGGAGGQALAGKLQRGTGRHDECILPLQHPAA